MKYLDEFSDPELAHAGLTIAEAEMLGALRLMTVARGIDPRDLVGRPNRDRAAATFSGQEPTPGRVHVLAERRNSAQAGNNDPPVSAHGSGHWCRLSSSFWRAARRAAV